MASTTRYEDGIIRTLSYMIAVEQMSGADASEIACFLGLTMVPVKWVVDEDEATA